VFSSDLTVLPAHPHVRSAIGMSHTCLCLPNYSRHSFYRPRRDGRLSWPGWLGYGVRKLTCPKAVAHPSTNRAQCRATALIESNALPLVVATATRPTENFRATPMQLAFDACKSHGRQSNRSCNV